MEKRLEDEEELQKEIEAGLKPPEAVHDLPLPAIPFVRIMGPSILQGFLTSTQYRCRQIMTRTDFLEGQ